MQAAIVRWMAGNNKRAGGNGSPATYQATDRGPAPMPAFAVTCQGVGRLGDPGRTG